MMGQSVDATNSQRKGGVISTFCLGILEWWRLNCLLLLLNPRQFPGYVWGKKGGGGCYLDKDIEEILGIERTFSFISISLFCDHRGYQTLTEKQILTAFPPNSDLGKVEIRFGPDPLFPQPSDFAVGMCRWFRYTSETEWTLPPLPERHWGAAM